MSKIIIKQNKDKVIVGVETKFYILNPEENVRYLWRVYKKVDDAWISINSDYSEGTSTNRTFSKEAEGNKYEVRVYKIVDAKNTNSTKDKYKGEEINILYLGCSEVFPKSINSIRNVKPEILEVHLMKEGEGSITKVSYQDTLIAFAKTQGLQGKKIHFHLWENDKQENDSKHSYSTKEFSAEVEADNIARLRIPLITHQKTLQYLANRYLPQGANGEGTEHEFCVTASFGILEKHSNEVQVKREIQKAYFVDKDKNKITKIEVGDVIQVCIESTGMIGAAVKYTIWEKDGKTKKERMEEDDPIYQSGLFYLWEDQYYCNKITVDKEFFERGKYLWEGDSESQNYSIEVHTFRDSKKSKPFELVYEDVEVKYGKSPVKVKVGEVKKEEKKEEKKKKEEPLEEGACPHCRKKHIDLQGDKKKFEFQGKGNKNCNLTCVKIIKKFEIIPEGAEYTSKYPDKGNGYECYYQLADENEERTKLIFRDSLIRGGKKIEVKEAYKYLDDALEHGHPIMVGVDHTLNRTFKKTTIENGIKKVKNIYINDTTTDHYVVIIGRDCDKGKVRYIFWDVGSDDGGKEWYFEKQEDGSLIAPKAHNSKTYTVTQIRRNRRKITEEIINKKTNEKTKKTKNEIITY
ncbi:hypothetical protein [Capnocytophaga sputigena]|uniref:hypothetical protein n=1 Tax=Capnocytophaga sputigena TaxID=1019 RepID=UPI0031F59BE0